MPYITQIEADGDLDSALANFSAVCAANAAKLGLAAPDLAEISDAATNFHSAFNASTAAKAAAHGAVEAKNTQKATSKSVISEWAKQFRANPAVEDELLADLMLPPHSTPGSETTPTIPLALVASANGDGVVNLKWNRNGNIQGTQFVIERRTSPSGTWTILDTSTRRTYVTMATPGQYVAFRVSAKRNGMTSPASTPAVLWDSQESVQLQIAA
jgi:hypothetical protein